MGHETETKKRVLIVDDDAVYALQVKNWLQDDYLVDVVSSGAQALRFLSMKKADLVLLDWYRCDETPLSAPLFTSCYHRIHGWNMRLPEVPDWGILPVTSVEAAGVSAAGVSAAGVSAAGVSAAGVSAAGAWVTGAAGA